LFSFQEQTFAQLCSSYFLKLSGHDLKCKNDLKGLKAELEKKAKEVQLAEKYLSDRFLVKRFFQQKMSSFTSVFWMKE
jgi:hypothetical protein